MSETDQAAPSAPEPAPAPVPPADPGHPSYAAPHPRFVDRVMDMRAVIAVALAALIIGGLSGFILGEHTGGNDGRFGRGGGFPGQRFPGTQGGPGQFGQQGQQGQQFGQGPSTP